MQSYGRGEERDTASNVCRNQALYRSSSDDPCAPRLPSNHRAHVMVTPLAAVSLAGGTHGHPSAAQCGEAALVRQTPDVNTTNL